jgi:hypothetical protein
VDPYRDLAPIDEPPARTDPDAIALYGLLVTVGAIPVVVALLARERFGASETIGLAMAVAGCVGAARQLTRGRARAGDSPRPPR